MKRSCVYTWWQTRQIKVQSNLITHWEHEEVKQQTAQQHCCKKVWHKVSLLQGSVVIPLTYLYFVQFHINFWTDLEFDLSIDGWTDSFINDFSSSWIKAAKVTFNDWLQKLWTIGIVDHTAKWKILYLQALELIVANIYI